MNLVGGNFEFSRGKFEFSVKIEEEEEVSIELSSGEQDKLINSSFLQLQSTINNQQQQNWSHKFKLVQWQWG